METKTISVTVKYALDNDGRLAMAKLGLPAQREQQIVLELPSDFKGIYILENGNAVLYAMEANFYKSSVYQHGREFATVNEHQYGTLSFPIQSVDDLLKLNATNELKRKEAETERIQRQNKLDIEYAEKQRKELLESAKHEAMNEAQKQMEVKYQKELAKLNTVRDLIANKQRVRTAQIKNIIG
jgi:hypothetical protein